MSADCPDQIMPSDMFCPQTVAKDAKITPADFRDGLGLYLAAVIVGADINSYKNGNILQLAALHNSQVVVQALIKLGCDPNLWSGGHQTSALEYAIFHNNIAMAKCLLDAGADPNVHVGKPLHDIVCLNRSPEFAALLIRHGADPNLNDGHSDCPLEKAKKMARFALVEAMYRTVRTVGTSQVR